MKVSASFGNEVWSAESFGQVIYAIKNRNGDIYLQMKKNNGDLSMMEVNSEKNSGFKSERAGGNYGSGTKVGCCRSNLVWKRLVPALETHI